MARPRSKEKQTALLHAAAKVVAVQGLEARTASIAQLAGVAEGTLFRYFATKDALLNELYLHLKQSMAGAMRKGFVKRAPLGDRVRSLWDGYIDWGIAHPSSVKALNQLAVSQSITAATRSRAARIVPEIQEVSRACIAKGRLRTDRPRSPTASSWRLRTPPSSSPCGIPGKPMRTRPPGSACSGKGSHGECCPLMDE